MKIVKKLDQHFEEVISAIFFAIMIVVIFSQVVLRYVFNYSLIWSEELARYLFIWQIYLGASLSIRKDSHLKIDVIYMIVPEKMKKYLKIFAYLLFMFFAIIIFKEGVSVVTKMLFVNKQLTPAMRLPMGMFYVIIPLSGFLMIIRTMQQIIKTYRSV